MRPDLRAAPGPAVLAGLSLQALVYPEAPGGFDLKHAHRADLALQVAGDALGPLHVEDLAVFALLHQRMAQRVVAAERIVARNDDPIERA